MAFWINEAKGVALETNEGGIALYNFETRDFSVFLDNDGIDEYAEGTVKAKSEAEAIAFALKNRDRSVYPRQ